MSSSNRKPYLTASVISQALLDASADNLSNQIELIVDIEAPDGSIIRASDRNKYVGEHFYEALTKFPDVTRTIGEFLGQGIVFSEMQFELSNSDGRFNKFLPGGASFAGWVGRSVIVKIGLRDVESSYVQIFRGAITEEGGFSRSIKSITIKARDVLEKVNVSFPTVVFDPVSYPKAEDDIWNTPIPLIYGDFTEYVHPGLASIPAHVINGADIFVNGEELTISSISLSDGTTPNIFTLANHRLNANDYITISSSNPSFPAALLGNKYVKQVTVNEFTISNTLGGLALGITSGDLSGTTTVVKEAGVVFANVQCKISLNANRELDTAHVFLRRSEVYYKVPQSHIVNVNADKNYFEITQDLPTFILGEDNWKYSTEDEFFCRVKGKNIPLYSDNIVAIGRDILETYTGLSAGDFDSSWSLYQNKASPAEGAIYHWQARAYIHDPQNALEYVVSMLEQVRLELFFNRSLKIALKALHWDEFVATPSFKVANWDIEKDSLTPQLDDRNNFNRVRAAYSYLPDFEDNAFTTGYFKNQAAITQSGKPITKVLVYPNLYIKEQVEIQAKETLKITSGYREVIACTLTTRAILLDVGDWVSLDVTIGSTQFSAVPCQIREISYSPTGLKLPVKLWAFTMLPFGAWNPSYNGIVGGQNATIISE